MLLLGKNAKLINDDYICHRARISMQEPSSRNGCGGGGSGGGISRFLNFFFRVEGGFLEDGARCYGVSAEIQRITSFK